MDIQKSKPTQANNDKAPSSASGEPQSNSTDKQRESNNALFKRLMSERTKKLDDLQQTHSVLQEKIPKTFNSNSPVTSKATIAFALLGDLVDECIYDVLFEAHRDIKLSNSICQICQTRCRSYVSRPGFDVFGQSYTTNNLPSYECVHCHKTIAASRYAPHLEKCLGLAGRQSSRVANRRLGSSSPFTSTFGSDESANISEPETASMSPNTEKKKKRPLPQSSSNGISRVKKLKGSLPDIV